MVALTVQTMSCAAAGQYSTSSLTRSALSSTSWMSNHSEDHFDPPLSDSEGTVVNVKIPLSYVQDEACMLDDAMSQPFHLTKNRSRMTMDNVLGFDIVQLQASLLRTAPIRREGQTAEKEPLVPSQPVDILSVPSMATDQSVRTEVSKADNSEPENAVLLKPAAARPPGSVFSWMRSKLGLGHPSDSSDKGPAADEVLEKVPTEVLPEVAEEILAVASTIWARPSHEFRAGRTARTSFGSSELLRTSSEPGIAVRRRRAREFARNLDFYKDMAEGDEPAPKRRSLSMTNLPEQAQGSRSSGEEERKLNAVRAQGVQQAFQKSRASVGQRDLDSDSTDLAFAPEYLTPELVERVSAYCAPTSERSCDIASSELFKSCSPFS